LPPVLCLVLAFFFAPSLFAQKSGYYISPGSGGSQFIQRISWPKNENASQYELIIERRGEPRAPVDSTDDTAGADDSAGADNAEGADDAEGAPPPVVEWNYTEAYRVITAETRAEFSLPPGNYRYRVIVYNLLRQAEYAAPWVDFVILHAFQPELSDFGPRRFEMARGGELELVLEGRNLLPESEIRLERLGQSIPPRSYRPDPSGERALAVYNAPDLAPGSYKIRVTNPGGLETILRGLSIDSTASVLLAYAPLFPFMGYIFETPETAKSAAFDKFFYPVGAEIRVTWFPITRSWGSLGVEGLLGWSYLKGRANSADITAHLGELGLNVFYRKELNRLLALRVRAGGGFGAVLGLSFDHGIIQSPVYNTMSPMVDLGVSLEWNLLRAFYAELGADGFHVFSVDTPRSLYLRPFAGLGLRF
jgi:hypothetical protein